MELIEGENSRYCTGCDKYKSFDKFGKGLGKYGIKSQCRKCNYDNVKDHIKNNQSYKIRFRLSSSLYNSLKGSSKSKSTEELLGITFDEFKDYLEKQFDEGMTWDNWGRDGWHIDHIVPCSHFDHSKPHEVEECWFYTNMQPMWAEDNWKKNDNYE